MIMGHEEVDSSIVNWRTPKGALITFVVAVALAACGSSCRRMPSMGRSFAIRVVWRRRWDGRRGSAVSSNSRGTACTSRRHPVGERYPIVWPAGTRWDADTQTIVTPDGESLSAGDEVYGGGGYLYVDDVDRLAGADAAALARRCVDNTYGEIAVVNNSDSAIGGRALLAWPAVDQAPRSRAGE